MESTDLLDFHLFEDNTFVQEIDRIVKERWRVIERTTRYGWLSAKFYGKVLSDEDSRLISTLANKIDAEDRYKAIQRIRKYSRNLHPRHVVTFALDVLNEAYTEAILRCERPKSCISRASLKVRSPTIYTISDA